MRAAECPGTRSSHGPRCRALPRHDDGTWGRRIRIPDLSAGGRQTAYREDAASFRLAGRESPSGNPAGKHS